MDAVQLLKLKDKVKSQELEVEKEKGKLETIKGQLKSLYDCDTLEELNALIDTKKEELASKTIKKEEVENQLKELIKESYPELVSSLE